MRLGLDYETRSRADLKKTGAIVYAQDESTSLICLAYKIDDEATRLWLPERCAMPDDLWDALQSATLTAYNASFERAITRYVLPRYHTVTREQEAYLQNLPIPRWRCTAAKTAACSLPRALGEAAKALSLPIRKDMEGNRLVKKYSKPRKPTKNNPSQWWGDKEELRKIYRYCITDVDVEYAVDQALPDLSQAEQRVWELDQRINDRGILIDIPLVKRIMALIRQEQAHITESVQELSQGAISAVTQTAKVLAWVNARGAQMENLRAESIRDKLLGDDLDFEAREMLIHRQWGSKSSTAKYAAMLHAVGTDHRARELLLYGGAQPTMRWSGKRLQPQNMARPHLPYSDIEKILGYINE